MTAPTNAQRGKAFENEIDWQNAIYESTQIARIRHNGTQGRIHRGRAILVASQVDYAGPVVSLGGRMIAFDAKMCASLRYAHPADRLHQLRDLYELEQFGALAFLMVRYSPTAITARREEDRYFMVWPQVTWRDMRPFTIRLDEMGKSDGVEFYRTGYQGLPDYVQVLEQIAATKGVSS